MSKYIAGALRTRKRGHAASAAGLAARQGMGFRSMHSRGGRLIANAIARLGRQLRPTKKVIFGQFILAIVSVIASLSAVWNTKLTSDSVKQLEEQRLANYRPSVFISPLELTVTVSNENGAWKVEDKSQKSKVNGEEGPIKDMQLANVGKGAIEGLQFSWRYPNGGPDLSKFGLELRPDRGQTALYVDGEKFHAAWIEPQPSIVLTSDNEIRGVNFIADPIQFVIFDQIVKKSVQQNAVSGNAEGFKQIGVIRGAELMLKYRNIEGNIYTQKFNFYFQPYHCTVAYDSHGMVNRVEYKVSVIVEPEGIEPVARPFLGLYLRP